MGDIDFDSINVSFELSEDDYAKIDALSSPTVQELGRPEESTKAPSPPPPIPDEAKELRGSSQKLPTESLYGTFRSRRNFFSVTDLVEPAWCEVKYDYGLRWKGKARMAVEKRPNVLVTKQGKEIAVQKAVAVTGEKIMRAGEAIHKKLEREIHPVEVRIRTSTKEEGWALRFFNMLSSLESLMTMGCCREMPVVGFVHGHLVLGVIDEINRKEGVSCESPVKRMMRDTPSTPKRRKSKTPEELSPSASQPDITQFFSPRPGSPSKPPPLRKLYSLYLGDNKTRGQPSLPPERNTIHSRLQLMLYKRLFDTLLSLDQVFDFDGLWAYLGLDRAVQFSPDFLTQIYVLCESNGLSPSAWTVLCLDDIVVAWIEAVQRLQLGDSPSEKQLELVYRLRSNTSNGTWRRRQPKRSASGNPAAMSLADESPTDRPVDDVPHGPDNEGLSPWSDIIGAGFFGGDNDPELNWALEQSLSLARGPGENDAGQQVPLETVVVPFVAPAPAPKRELEGEDIIGKVRFDYDEAMLDNHLEDVLDFWFSKREPNGVAMEDAGRCNFCEYSPECEWRESRAAEFASKSRAARAAVEIERTTGA